MRRLFIFGLLSLAMTLVATAHQRGATVPAVPPPAMHAMPAAPIAGAHAVPLRVPSPVHSGARVIAPGPKPVVSHKPAGRPVLPRPLPPSSSTFTSNSFSPGAPFFDNSNPVPGLGFDYVHFFAVHPNWGASHPVTGVVLPFFGGGGFYIPVPYYTESTPQEEAQENVSNEQPESNRRAYAQEPSASAPSRSTSYSPSPSEPVAEFVFVKRDGSTLFAVAYILLNDKVQYVTKEGLRRSVALDSLDFAATQKFNEELGNTINLPALSRPVEL